MKYDIEFVLPITFNEKYKIRANDFKKIGLLNVNKSNILVNFLIGNEEPPKGFFNDFEYEYKIISSRYKLHSNKISDFYLNIDIEKLNSKWIMKIDDDSCTDVDGLLTNLENEFDYKREYNIITDYRHEIDVYENQILREMGYSYWLDGPKLTVAHEWECNILSQAAIKRIFSNQRSKDFLLKRTNIDQGAGDQHITLAARIAKIYPVDAWFLTQYSDLTNFSAFGGGLINHIHYISRDKDLSEVEFIIEMLESNRTNVSDKDFAFYVDGKPMGIMTFLKNGRIANYKHDNEFFWTLSKNDLIIYNKLGKISTKYVNFLEKLENCFGEFKINPAEKHLLKLIK